jgi:hypothetical protein
MSEPKYWTGEIEHCDICRTKAINLTVVVDGATRMGPWALMCHDCFTRHGIGIGLGVGQRYQKQPDGRWLKVTG